MTRLRGLFLLSLAALLFAAPAEAHSFDAATLTLTDEAEGKFAIDWRTTAKTLEGLREPAQYPKSCRQQGALLECGPLGLVGNIDFPWLAGGESSVTVLIDWSNGSRFMRVVNGRSPTLTVYGIPPSAGLRFLGPIALDYTRLGVEHILTGFDHLMQRVWSNVNAAAGHDPCQPDAPMPYFNSAPVMVLVQAIQAARAVYGADRIVGEQNQGGEMVTNTITRNMYGRA